MNKVSRLLGSAALATGLIFGGSTGVAFANDGHSRDDNKSSYDTRDRNRDRDRDRDRNDRNHNDYKYLLRCSNGHGHHYWYEWSYNKYDNRRHCDVVLKVRVRY